MKIEPVSSDPKTAITIAARNEVARLVALLELLPRLDSEVAAQALRTCGSADGAASWLLAERQRGLPPGSPIDLAQSAEGKVKVLNILCAIEHGGVV